MDPENNYVNIYIIEMAWKILKIAFFEGLKGMIP